jgi:uncharacterized membrane protein YfcA
MNALLLASLLSGVAGLSLGLLGGGGSVLAVPILLYAAHLDPDAAITLSLLMVGLGSLAATVPHARAGNVSVRAALAFAAASLAGSFVGGRLSHFVPSRFLLASFTIIMVVTGVMMLRGRRASPGSSKSVQPARIALYGAAVGLLTGLVGAGGGFVIVPVLTMLVGLSMPAAVGTSLAIIAANSMLAFAARFAASHLSLSIAALLTVSTVVGSLSGAQLAAQVSPAKLRKGFAWLVLTVAAMMAVQQLPWHDLRNHEAGHAQNTFGLVTERKA